MRERFPFANAPNADGERSNSNSGHSSPHDDPAVEERIQVVGQSELGLPSRSPSEWAYHLREELEQLFSTRTVEPKTKFDSKAWEELLKSETTSQISDVIASQVEKQRLLREKVARERGEEKRVKAIRPELPPPKVILDCVRDLKKTQSRKGGSPMNTPIQLEFMAKSLAEWGIVTPRTSRDNVDKQRKKFEQAAKPANKGVRYPYKNPVAFETQLSRLPIGRRKARASARLTAKPSQPAPRMIRTLTSALAGQTEPETGEPSPRKSQPAMGIPLSESKPAPARRKTGKERKR